MTGDDRRAPRGGTQPVSSRGAELEEPPARSSGEQASTARRSGGAVKRQTTSAPATPRSLAEFYTGKPSGAAHLLTHLALHDQWQLSQEDEDKAIELVAERDPELQKTRALAAAALTSHGGRFASTLERFLVHAIEGAIVPTQGWPPSADAQAPELLHRLLDRHRRALKVKDPPRRVFNALMVAYSILVSRHDLSVEHAAPLLANAFGQPAWRRRGSLSGGGGIVSLAYPPLGVDAVRAWLDLLAPWVERATRELARGDAAEFRAAEAETERDRLSSEAERLRSELLVAHERIDALTDDLRAIGLARQHQQSQLRDALTGFLTDDLRLILHSAREGLTLQPPRVEYSLERLEDAEHAIEGRVRWLRSSG